VIDMQAALTRLGFYQGEADGLVGPKTRAALRLWQKSIGVPADGYPAADLVERLIATR
jgi:membrane-bound lytic murein transglycosylase B